MEKYPEILAAVEGSTFGDLLCLGKQHFTAVILGAQKQKQVKQNLANLLMIRLCCKRATLGFSQGGLTGGLKYHGE